MNSDVYYYYAPEQHRAGNALRETFLFPSVIRLLGSPISTASIRWFACNRLCCITQVRNSRLVTASADWISDGHLRRTSQASAGRLPQRRRRPFRCVSAQCRLGRQDVARFHRWHHPSHDRASGTLTAVLPTHRHSPPSSQTHRPRRLTFARLQLFFSFFFSTVLCTFPSVQQL
jgi:hypothetical protein